MEITVKEKYLKTTPRKLRLVADQFKNKPAKDTAEILTFVNKAAASKLRSAILSALAIAKEKDLDGEKFKIKEIRCDQGSRLKRRIMRSRGQSSLIQKRLTHLTIILSDQLNEKVAKKLKPTEKQPKVANHSEVDKPNQKKTKVKKINKLDKVTNNNQS